MTKNKNKIEELESKFRNKIREIDNSSLKQDNLFVLREFIEIRKEMKRHRKILSKLLTRTIDLGEKK